MKRAMSLTVPRSVDSSWLKAAAENIVPITPADSLLPSCKPQLLAQEGVSKPFPLCYYDVVSGSANSILLETSRPDRENRFSYLFLNPIRILKAEALDDIPKLFVQVERALEEGCFVAGFMSYECGYHFEPSVINSSPRLSPLPLAWFGVYEGRSIFNHASGQFESDVPLPSQDLIHPVPEMQVPPLTSHRLAMSWDEYRTKVDLVRDYLAAGDAYQVNFTNKIHFDFSGSAASLFRSLRNQQRVPYSAFLHLDGWDVCSFSPELFLRIENGRIITRPMKGTAPRGRNVSEDDHLQKWLQDDPKNRSENVMIVDLLRNDLGRIAEIGSIKVDDLFAVEKYDTLFQMTSTVSGALRRGTTFYEIFRALFPCGSVTGAPKVRAMQIIHELENEPRGVYTGAIGYFSPNRDAVFSVAIRTIVLNGGSGELGVGGGIVWDSHADEEAKESQLKGRFLTAPQPSFQLVESLLWDRSYFLLDPHLKRLKSSADYFGFPFDEAGVVSALEDNLKHLRAGLNYKVRLLLGREGTVSVENIPIEPRSGRSTVILSRERSSSLDRFLYHKTTYRPMYERLFAEAQRQGHEDVILANENGELTEGTNNNIFIEMKGKLLTPTVECGLLPGVLRQHLLENDPRASEQTLTISDLRAADAIYLCNSVRGLRQVTLVDVPDVYPEQLEHQPSKSQHESP